MSKVENGDSNPGIGFFYKLSLVHNADLEYIIFGNGNMFKEIEQPGENDDREFSEVETLNDMVWMLKKSPIFRTDMIAYANKFIFENETLLRKNIQKEKEKKKPL